MFDFYNEQVIAFANSKDHSNPRDFVNSDPTKISWTAGLLSKLASNNKYSFNVNELDGKFRTGAYRPFCKEHLFLDQTFNERPGKYDSIIVPTPQTPNLMICVPTQGTKGLGVLITDSIPDLNYLSPTQCFPLYYYEKAEKNLYKTEGEPEVDGYVQKPAITDDILQKCRDLYGDAVTKEDIFFYVYGALHSPSYRERYEYELKKELARLPLPEHKGTFLLYSDIGRQLADIHINYETGKSTITNSDGKYHKPLAPYPMNVHFLKPNEPVPAAPNQPLIDGDVTPITVFISNSEGLSDAELYRVDKKMKLGEYKKEKGKSSSIKEPPKGKNGTLVYNEHITFTNIPLRAFDYVVNGRSPIEWIVERYYRRVDKASGIVNDPNLWAPDNPKYIFDLIPRLVALSLKTLELTEGLPDLEEGEPTDSKTNTY